MTEQAKAWIGQSMDRPNHRCVPRSCRRQPIRTTDTLVFLVRGFDAISLGCVDTDIGAPRNYHWPTDDVAHLDEAQLMVSLEHIEAVARSVIETQSRA